LTTVSFTASHVCDIEASQEEAQAVGQQRLVRFEGRAEIRFEAVNLRWVKQEWRLVSDAPPAVHRLDSISIATGSGRSSAGFHNPCAERGALWRSCLPCANRS
jgi:hypothetical protein